MNCTDVFETGMLAGAVGAQMGVPAAAAALFTNASAASGAAFGLPFVAVAALSSMGTMAFLKVVGLETEIALIISVAVGIIIGIGAAVSWNALVGLPITLAQGAVMGLATAVVDLLMVLGFLCCYADDSSSASSSASTQSSSKSKRESSST